MPPDDPFNLERFVEAQAKVFHIVVEELEAGAKKTHWIWFIFPQLRELGTSPKALHFGISGLDEARAYLNHPLLGKRLRKCVDITLTMPADSLKSAFGSPDDMKYQSCMTLFAHVEEQKPNVFIKALFRWCEGAKDDKTQALLG
jgi:uncharacterized protein (DUF1810 family)